MGILIEQQQQSLFIETDPNMDVIRTPQILVQRVLDHTKFRLFTSPSPTRRVSPTGSGRC